jgi:hypothetical protein
MSVRTIVVAFLGESLPKHDVWVMSINGMVEPSSCPASEADEGRTDNEYAMRATA